MTGLPPDWRLKDCDLVTMMGAYGAATRRAGQVILESETTSKRLVKEATSVETAAIARWKASHERQTSR